MPVSIITPLKGCSINQKWSSKTSVLDAKLRSQSKMQSVKIFPQSKTKQKYDLEGIIIEERGLQNTVQGLSWWLSGKESACQCRRHGFDPWSRRIPHCSGAAEPVSHNYWACAPEPGSYNYWSLSPLEPMLHNKRSHSNEKPLNHNQSSPCLPQLDKSQHNQ